MRRRRVARVACRVVGFLGAALVCLPGTAGAAEVTARVDYVNEGQIGGEVKYTAAPGEVNRLTISEGDQEIVFRDSDNPIDASGRCVQLDERSARCPATTRSHADLGDGDDHAREIGASVKLDGGSGDDTILGARYADNLVGGGGDDRLDGGDGADVLAGGAGTDDLKGGGGADLLTDAEDDAEAMPDVFDGGDNPRRSGDRISYAGRTAGVTVDLETSTTSAPDELSGIEGVIGGAGPDRLSGDSRPNLIDGGAGDDTVAGLGGADVLYGGAGADDVSGGRGNDELDEGPSERPSDRSADLLRGGAGDDVLYSAGSRGRPDDTVACGSGTDVTVPDGRDPLRRDCDAVHPELRLTPLPRFQRDAAVFSLRCRYGPCRLRFALATTETALTEARIRMRQGRRNVRVPWSASDRKTALSAGRLCVTVRGEGVEAGYCIQVR